jgi:MFS family permease
VWLLPVFHHHYPSVFFVTLLPGLAAAAVIALLVKEKTRVAAPHISFGERLNALPQPFRKFLLAVGLFGAGDFAHTMLILLATQKLSGEFGAQKAATIAVSLYVLRNILYAGFAFVAGWLADHFNKRALLSGGYALAAAMALALVFAPMTLPVFVLVFAIAGIYIATQEALEDSLAAELVEKDHHGMGFGALATVNGVGDFLSSVVVGILWATAGAQVAFAYSAVLFTAGAVLVWRAR